MNEFLQVSYLLSPLLMGLVVHGLCIKFGWLSSLAKPIDGGRAFRGKQLFGNNKTYRGLIAVGLGTALGFSLQTFVLHSAMVGRNIELLNYSGLGTVALGFAVGVAAMLSELPNSFLKRRMSIAPGVAGSGLNGILFYLLDQIDLLLGIWLVLSLAVAATASRISWSIVFLFVAHQILTIIGYGLGMRATPR